MLGNTQATFCRSYPCSIRTKLGAFTGINGYIYFTNLKASGNYEFL